MVALPAETPNAEPVADPILTTPAALLLHVPPVVASLTATVLPWQKLKVPDMGAGNELTTIVACELQPLGKV
jgi:hypothetical protein